MSATTEDSNPASAQPSDSQTARAAHSDELAAADSVEALLQKAVDHLGGRHRAGQAQMAKSVAAAMQDGVHLLVQAGTGTG
ncbi:MAG TPA: ATP-dependent DNA helicase, partial [Actinomycetales bacterium]|nr:ATP-dependent DNA helicase [Actinomycetales bacterium]